jgi:hypothetical protein
LTLLAIATYTSRKGDALDGQDVSIESPVEAEVDAEEEITLDIA